MDAHQTVDTVARNSYGRLVAYLSARSRDVAGAEDALGDALHAALTNWPRDGTPENPEAWLLAVARRRMLDASRRTVVRERATTALQVLAEIDSTPGSDVIPDERLKLMFICAHPAIDAGIRTPLMLQTVLGLDADRIASAFLVAPATMGQRLVRAKKKIRAAGIPFEPPEKTELAPRLDAVLEAIYAAYGTGWDDAFVVDADRRGLAEEAIWLARVVVSLLADAAEAHGLLALMLHCEARRSARRSPDGAVVPLSEQDPSAWSASMIEEAEATRQRASRLRAPGRFQIEAAIQAAHAQRFFGRKVDRRMIASLYDALVAIAPTLGAHVGRVAAIGEAGGHEAALAELQRLPADRVAAYQPFWALRAHLCAQAGNLDEAREAYTRAIGLSEDESVRRFLSAKRDRLKEL